MLLVRRALDENEELLEIVEVVMVAFADRIEVEMVETERLMDTEEGT